MLLILGKTDTSNHVDRKYKREILEQNPLAATSVT